MGSNGPQNPSIRVWAPPRPSRVSKPSTAMSQKGTLRALSFGPVETAGTSGATGEPAGGTTGVPFAGGGPPSPGGAIAEGFGCADGWKLPPMRPAGAVMIG